MIHSFFDAPSPPLLLVSWYICSVISVSSLGRALDSRWLIMYLNLILNVRRAINLG